MGLRASVLHRACAAIALLALASYGEAYAEQVGVAAAVNPDAFSSLSGKPEKQLNIGKSIFYNERINTTASGLVQVLLVDGSTFTVGPNSSLVIDKFVYDPNKRTGEVVATFSKGAMRFVGGKISKTEGGVKIETPAGVLAIRGGIAYGLVSSPKNFAFLFVFGEYLKLQGAKIFEPGYGFFGINGKVETRPFTADDIRGILAALGNSHAAGSGGQEDVKPSNSFQLVTTESMSELISDANTTQILAQIKKDASEQSLSCEETGTCEPPPPPPSCEETGTCEPPPPPPSCEETGTCEPPPPPPSCEDTGTCGPPTPEAGHPGGYAAGIYDRQGSDKANGLLQDAMFDPESRSVSFGISNGEAVVLGFDEDGNPISASVTLNDNPLDVIQYQSQTQLTTKPDPICDGCSDMEWGGWEAHLNYGAARGNTNLFARGWWISGELTTVGNIDTLAALDAHATYNGTAWGSVINDKQSYDASGNLTMKWNFRDRDGDLTISKFDTAHVNGGLTFSSGVGGMKQVPADFGYKNEFTGVLSGSGMNGSATGSFVNNGSVAAGGIMGNWNVQGQNYQATGIFGGAGTPK